MLKKFLFALTVVLMFSGSFAVATYAQKSSLFKGASPRAALSPALPISALPPVVLSQAEQVKLSNMLGAYDASKVGLSAESFRETRTFSVGTGESMYVVPGTNGVCLVLGNGFTCGDMERHQIGLFRVDASTGVVSGAGITDSSVDTVTETVNDKSAVAHVERGTYVIAEDAGLRVPVAQPLHLQVSVSVS